MQDSNRRQPRCKRGALPAELIARGVVPRKGLEPLCPFGHMALNHARLPIPPPRHVGGIIAMKRRIVNMCYNIAYSFPIRKGQVMALAFTIVIALVLVVLGLVGYIRDLRRGLLALIGTLAGASLVSFWAAPWGLALAGSFV